MQLISADTLIPMHNNALLRDAALLIQNDKILATGKTSDLQQQFPTANHEHHPGLLLPGFINAHTHAELTHYHLACAQHLTFPDWVEQLMELTPRDPALLCEITRDAVRTTINESVAFGVTTLGDISRQVLDTRPEFLRRSNTRIRVVSFGEVLALGAMRHRLEGSLTMALDFDKPRQSKQNLVHAGVSPHAPYTVEGPALQEIIKRALKRRAPIAMHLAENREEADFLRDLSGPLGRSWKVMQRLKTLDDQIPLFEGGPIAWADHHGLLAASHKIPVLLAHVNYCSDQDLALLAKSKASVVYCPRTRHYFGHDQVTPHRYRDMLNAGGGGVNVCLGTDSLASNPDRNILKEAQLLFQRDAIPPQLAFDMITWRAAQALGLNAGRLTPNTLADFILMPLPTPPTATLDSLLTQLLHETPAPTAVWIAGQKTEPVA
jgi:cytosine/adenosine deaminase-related metal-dependent hydrolase